VKQAAGVRFDFVGPKMSLPLPDAQRKKYAELKQKHDKLDADSKRAVKQAAADQKLWEREMIAALRNPPKWTPLTPVAFESTGGESYKILDDGSVLLGGSVPGTTTYTITVRTSIKNITGFKLETLTHSSLPGKGPGRGDEERTNFVLNEFSVAQVDTANGDVLQPVKLTHARADYSQPRWDVGGLIDGNAKSGWAIAEQFHKPHWAAFNTSQPLNPSG